MPDLENMTAMRNIAYESGPVKVPVKLWRWNNVRLMTHVQIGNPLLHGGAFRVSEETTGFGVPNTYANDIETAEKLAVEILTAKADQLPAVLAKRPIINP